MSISGHLQDGGRSYPYRRGREVRGPDGKTKESDMRQERLYQTIGVILLVTAAAAALLAATTLTLL